MSRFMQNGYRPQFPGRGLWLCFWAALSLNIFTVSCKPEEKDHKAFLLLKTGTAYTPDGSTLPAGSPIRIGIMASGAGVPLTYLRIERIINGDTLTQLDRGIFAGSEGYDQDFTFSKDTSGIELWRVIVMNADRDTAVRSLTFYLGGGTAYGPVEFFSNVRIGMQTNTFTGHFLDLHTGQVFDDNTVAGHEAVVDLVAYFYITSGLPSPTFTCPGYTAAVAYYPQFATWSTKNSLLYDYKTSDNNLLTAEQFYAAENDSLLVSGYQPEKVSGNCKYCYTGKVIPFKTQEGKYGLIHVVQADEKEDGIIGMDIKIQK